MRELKTQCEDLEGKGEQRAKHWDERELREETNGRRGGPEHLT